MPEFYIRPMFDRKIFFRDFVCVCVAGVTGQRPSPVSYAYGWAPGPPPAKSGPDKVLDENSSLAYGASPAVWDHATLYK